MLPDAELPLYRPAVGIMLVNAVDLVFVGRRIDMPAGLAAWQMPQGGIDPGETPREAAFRELNEEVGTHKAEIIAETQGWLHYDVPPEIIIEITQPHWGGRYRGQRQKWFLMRFTGADTDIDVATEHPEFDAWEWVEPARLPELIVPFKRQLYRDILAEFRDYLRSSR
jgi:putative (di)nucleoside polyphosphate hydrolase